MSFPVLPTGSSAKDLDDFLFTGRILLPFSEFEPTKHALSSFPDVAIYLNALDCNPSVDDIIKALNVGVDTIFVKSTLFGEIEAAGLPASRFAVDLVTDSNSASVVSAELDAESFKEASASGNRPVYYFGPSDQLQAESLVKLGYTVVVPSSQLSARNEKGKIDIGDVFVSTLVTDRPDGLYTTLVTAAGPAKTALGIVYSSKASIKAAIASKEGVYQSRKRTSELWYKGKTSGATQKLVSLLKDCDSDVLQFVVEQKEGTGFCHVSSSYTCFGDHDLIEGSDAFGSGLARLDATLADRVNNAPEGLYTKRLFTESGLLEAKLKEELDELIDAGRAGDKQEVAWEAADLIYFAMTWAVKHGVRLTDIEKNLDIKSRKVTRRKGDAKPGYVGNSAEKADKAQSTEVQKVKKDDSDYSLEIIDTASASKSDVARALTRPVQKTADIMKLVRPIIEQVQKDGDQALLDLTAKFDGVKLELPILSAPFPAELMAISEEMKDAIDLSMSNIEKFHRAQLPSEEVMTVETAPGVFCLRFAKPIENVGLYVPGGTAVLPSTAMMLGVPAKVAGCHNIILASPPARETGRLTPEVVYVAHKLGASAIVMAGGAQAVAALAYGTLSVTKCDKILGPGNQFVTAAKMHVQNDTQALCSIDMPAGPSEVLVVADEAADADFVASDLLSQAEHGVDSQVILVGVKLLPAKLEEFSEAIRRQAAVLPRREIVAKCLAHSYVLLVETYEEAFKMSNEYAPEHLILQIENAEKYVPSHIENAGSVFVGALSPESCGDYSSGTNHTLPTYGYARQYSGVNTATFQKFITSQNVTKDGLRSIGKAVMTLAAVEGLEAHRYAVQVRMDKLGLH